MREHKLQVEDEELGATALDGCEVEDFEYAKNANRQTGRTTSS